MEMQSHGEEMVEEYDVKSVECNGDGHKNIGKVRNVMEMS